ncbi:MAG: hypothetical protein K2Z81_06320 [Cyanobacteria bacterium]|nr:hypothetical protein [Cyanobacteriota bacterium]
MSDIPESDVKKAADALSKGVELKELGSPIEHIQKQLIDPNKKDDPTYEIRFNAKLDEELEKRGVLPKLMLEYAEENFPRFGNCRLLGDINKVDNFLMHKNEFIQLSSQATVYRLNPSTGSLSTINDALTPSMTPTSVDRMMLRNFYDRFDHINRNYSAYHRGGGWLGHKVFTGSITVGDLRKWSAKESQSQAK